MHCPGKKGAYVSRCLEKQMYRVGLNSFDVVAGTGDGGGENEGHQGVHWYFESLGTGYVRRRCIPHISWRTCDLAIRVSGLDLKAMCTYFVMGLLGVASGKLPPQLLTEMAWASSKTPHRNARTYW